MWNSIYSSKVFELQWGSRSIPSETSDTSDRSDRSDPNDPSEYQGAFRVKRVIQVILVIRVIRLSNKVHSEWNEWYEWVSRYIPSETSDTSDRSDPNDPSDSRCWTSVLGPRIKVIRVIWVIRVSIKVHSDWSEILNTINLASSSLTHLLYVLFYGLFVLTLLCDNVYCKHCSLELDQRTEETV